MWCKWEYEKIISIASVFLICLLAFSTAPLTFGNYASAASVGAANFLPNVSYTDYFDTAYESTLSLQTAQYITNELDKLYGASPNQNYYKYESTCKNTDYTNTLNTIKNNYDKAVVFSKGHRVVLNVNGYTRYGLIPWPGNTSYLDYQIYGSTSTDNIVTFIWHCQTAMNYNGNGVIPRYPDTTHYGLPYCFTHNANMQRYGNSGNQVYLGAPRKRI
ncbi:MAG: hypothetical protein LBE76_00665 [Nitrososphaerota archaeon]|jgi:hypothetical protein|nr:hypothetical protein [Nitrososphaerota archaeon]